MSGSFPTSCLSPITAQPDLETALQLLEQFASRINPLSALAVIPDNVHVSRIHQFLQTALHKSVQNRRRAQLLKGLLYAEHLQCQETRLHLQSQSIHITDLNVCPVCKKRFGNQRCDYFNIFRNRLVIVVYFSVHLLGILMEMWCIIPVKIENCDTLEVSFYILSTAIFIIVNEVTPLIF